MNNKDLNEKLLTGLNEVFSDIFNTVCFNGQRVIKEEELSDTPSISVYIESDNTRQLERDVSKYYRNSSLNIALLNIENQTKDDKDMPFRMIGYEGAQYNYQLLCGNNQIYGVASLILNFNPNKRWSSPLTLKECINAYPEEFDEYINDYKIHVIDIAFLEKEDIDKFSSDFKVIADFFYQRRKLGEYVYRSKDILKYPAQTMRTLDAINSTNIFETANNECRVVNNMGGVTMENIFAIERDKGRVEGIEEGLVKGKNEGILLTLTKNVKALISNSLTFDQSCNMLNIDEETREKLLDTGEFSPYSKDNKYTNAV